MKVFVAHSARDRELAIAVVALLREDGHEVFHPDELTATPDLFSEISAAIRSADAVIAILAGSNPNVFYEIGLAVGASVPTLITSHPREPLPADLASVPYVQLTGDPLRDAQTIARRVKDLEGRSPARGVTFSSAEATLRAASNNPAVLEALAPSEFERLVADLFRERGYEVSTTPLMCDSGVDFLIRYPSHKQVVLIEVKKLSRQSRVSVEAVRRLLGTVSLAATGSRGVLVSTSGFTAAALALAFGTPVVLRTLDDILNAKSKTDLIEPKKTGG